MPNNAILSSYNFFDRVCYGAVQKLNLPQNMVKVIQGLGDIIRRSPFFVAGALYEAAYDEQIGNNEVRKFFVTSAAIYSLMQLIILHIQSLYPKMRPAQAFSAADSVLNRHHKSFLSVHTADAFFAAGLLMHRKTHTHSKVIALALATLTGASRIIAHKHWFSDVVRGAALGLTCAIGAHVVSQMILRQEDE